MNLYLISRPDRVGYDEYDSAVVCANSEGEARRIHPSENEQWTGVEDTYGSWVNANRVRVKLIGVAVEGLDRVVCASFNAG